MFGSCLHDKVEMQVERRNLEIFVVAKPSRQTHVITFSYPTSTAQNRTLDNLRMGGKYTSYAISHATKTYLNCCPVNYDPRPKKRSQYHSGPFQLEAGLIPPVFHHRCVLIAGDQCCIRPCHSASGNKRTRKWQKLTIPASKDLVWTACDISVGMNTTGRVQN